MSHLDCNFTLNDLPGDLSITADRESLVSLECDDGSDFSFWFDPDGIHASMDFAANEPEGKRWSVHTRAFFERKHLVQIRDYLNLLLMWNDEEQSETKPAAG